MRHQKKRHKLGRNASHRKATLIALGNALIAHKRITTTVARAKALRTFIEPVLSRAREDSQHNRRQAFRRLRDKQSVTTLFTEVAEKIGDRPGGYTRVVRIGRRAGDAAPMAVVELVDYNEADAASSGGAQKTRRTRRGRRRGGSASPAPEKQQEAVEVAEAPESADVSGDAEGEPDAPAEAVAASDDGDAVSEAEASAPEAEASAPEVEASASETEAPVSEAASDADVSDAEVSDADAEPEADKEGA